MAGFRLYSPRMIAEDGALKEWILTNVAEINRLKARIEETYLSREHSPKHRKAWEDACAAFHEKYDELAFPGGLADAFARILAGQQDAMEAALCFVECRPYFFRSGYLFKDLLRKLKKAPLSEPQKTRLAIVQANYAAYRTHRKTKKT